MVREIGGLRKDAIEYALNRIDGIKKLRSLKEIKELHKLLALDELPEAIITGSHKSRDGVLVATNRRAVFLHKDQAVEEYPYRNMTSIESHSTWLGIEVYIHTTKGKNKTAIKSVPKDQAASFVQHVQKRISRTGPLRGVFS